MARASSGSASIDRVLPGLRDVRSIVGAVAAGAMATAAMTATTRLERTRRRQVHHPVDYDASRHVAIAVGTVLGRPPRTEREERFYFALAHWGYGSAVALAYPVLRETTGSDRRAALSLFGGAQAMAMTLFPTIGGTPPPWRWRRDIVMSSVAQHAVYAAVVPSATRLTDRLLDVVRAGRSAGGRSAGARSAGARSAGRQVRPA